MQKILCLVSVILVSGLAGVNSLQCYVCFNCTKASEADLKTCGDPGTTVAPPETTTSPTDTTVTPTQTTAPSSSSQTPPSSSETPPSSSQTPPSSSETPPSSSQTPTTSSQTPASSSQTPASSSQTPASSSQTPTSSSETPPSSSSPSSSGSTSPSSGISPSSSTPASSEAVPGQNPGKQGGRSRRSVLSSPKKSNGGCNCKNETVCECGVELFLKRISQYADAAEYVCFKVTAIENGQEVVVRGCAPALIDGKAPCESGVAEDLKSCSTCSTDKCNASEGIGYSAFMLAATIVFMLFK